LFGSLVVSVQTLPALPEQIVGRLAGHWHTPPTHTVPDAAPLHPLPSGAVMGVGHPATGSQVPTVWHVPAMQVTAVPGMHEPPWHESPWVHALPSEHEVLFAAGGFEHVPVV
jgi:hypothetical protein